MKLRMASGAWRFLLGVIVLMFLGTLALLLETNAVAAKGSANPHPIQLTTSNAAPREVEDTTEKAIVRDYGSAWESMTRALAENRSDLLNPGFVGIARDKLGAQVDAQKKSGLRTRYFDRGHKLEAVFYSPEGSAMQLRDTAQLEMQVLDGDSVIHSEQITMKYLTVMTVAEDRWKVRVLEPVQSF